jgi:hypothetical protein
MKKVIFVTALSMGVVFAQAQKGSPHTEFGVKAGVNISNVSVDNSTNPDARASFHVGGLAHIHLDKQFAIQPELLFSSQGYKYTIAGTDYKVAINYITIPILGQLMFGEGFRVETGPQPGIMVSARSKVNGNSSDVGDSFKTFDLSWAFGLGYLTSSGFGVDARYNLGLTKINDGGGSIKNRVFAAGVFYQFKH